MAGQARNHSLHRMPGRVAGGAEASLPAAGGVGSKGFANNLVLGVWYLVHGAGCVPPRLEGIGPQSSLSALL